MNPEIAKVRMLIKSLKDTIGMPATFSQPKVLCDVEQTNNLKVRFVEISDFLNDDDGGNSMHLRARFSSDGSVDIVHTVIDFDAPASNPIGSRIQIGSDEMTALALLWLEWLYSDEGDVSKYTIPKME